jgi:hypothetical protein
LGLFLGPASWAEGFLPPGRDPIQGAAWQGDARIGEPGSTHGSGSWPCAEDNREKEDPEEVDAFPRDPSQSGCRADQIGGSRRQHLDMPTASSHFRFRQVLLR